MSKYYTKVTDGKLPKLYSDLLRADLVRMSGKEITIEIKEHRPVKSKYQSYYRAVIIPRLLAHLLENGDPRDPDKLSDELITAAGLVEPYTRLDGVVIATPKSTKDFTDDEWKNLLDFVKAEYHAVNFD